MSSDQIKESEPTKESFSLGYKKIPVPKKEDLEKIDPNDFLEEPKFDPSIFTNLLSGLGGGLGNDIQGGESLGFDPSLLTNLLSGLGGGGDNTEEDEGLSGFDPSMFSNLLSGLGGQGGPSGFDPSMFSNLLSGLGGQGGASGFDPSMFSNVFSGLENMSSDTPKKNTSKIEYNPFKINHIQNYNPIYKEIFELSPKNYNQISLNNKKQVIFNKDHIDETSVPIENAFIKYSPLLDPYRYLTGKYTNDESLRTLPKIISESESINSHYKLNDPNNASYIDNFFCYLSSQLLNKHSFQNAIDYYGSYLGVQEKFRVNIADDMDYLRNSEYFSNNKNILYEIDMDEEDPFANFGSRKNKDKIVLHNESNISHLSIEDLDNGSEDPIIITDEIEQVYENEKSDDDDSSNDSEMNYTSSDEDDEDDATVEEDEEDTANTVDEEPDDDDHDDDDDEEDEAANSADDEEADEEDDEEESEEEEEDPPLYAYVKDFPIQMICLEPCKGTIDSLFNKGELDEQTAGAALMQIIMSLIAFQKAYHFTHNDLHTNNIMYIDTTDEFIYYKFNKIYYKVPTYGRIYKIIDFGRAIYKFQGRTYCSDSFGPDGDANSQYNFEPYFNDKKPRLEPNYSFDLCRLGCSIYDFILDEDYFENVNNEEIDDLQRTVIRWCSDDNGKNVLYKKNGEERYPNFKLYKMIARTVNKHTPEQQLMDPYFSKYAIKKTTDIGFDDIINIDILPCYA
jgi:hypothetical protein